MRSTSRLEEGNGQVMVFARAVKAFNSLTVMHVETQRNDPVSPGMTQLAQSKQAGGIQSLARSQVTNS